MSSSSSSSPPDAPQLHWLAPAHGPNALSHGVAFGMPWAKGRWRSGQAFHITGADGHAHPLDCREVAFWPDGSLKWTAHSVAGGALGYSDSYTIQPAPAKQGSDAPALTVTNHRVATQLGLELTLAAPGSARLFEKLSLQGTVICAGADVVASIDRAEYTTRITAVEVENATFTRIVVKVSGVVVAEGKAEHLPFDVRIYVYQETSTIGIVHSFVHDLEANEPLTSLGLRFHVPLADTELYNRHVRLGSSNGGILGEEVQGLSGLRFGPSVQNKVDQTAGKVVTLAEEDWKKVELTTALKCIPSWDAYSLSQLSSDGYTLKKRTKAGCSWVKVTGGGRADGTAYVGSAKHGGLAVGMANFWERYPTQLDLTDLTQDESAITVWLYAPSAEPLDTSPYHDGLGMDTHVKQIEGLNVTYEDFEPGFATANGIGRSNQLFIKPFLATPSKAELSSFSSQTRDATRLVATPEYMHSTGVFYGCWSPDHHNLKYTPSPKELSVEKNLETLFSFYHGQVEQNRWYGFWDHGDFQHTYDPHRHAWRYDVGGYAWDNSELSTDLWLWLYFLHTGRADVFKMAQAMTQHTSEVDMYHTGRFKGFGTRHGVQHWSDSSKQLRISNVLFKRIYFYLTGDERTGALIEELSTYQDALLTLDSHRKVQLNAGTPDGFAMANIGLDCGPLATTWLTAWERRSKGWEHAQKLLLTMLDGISNLPHGIANNAMLLNTSTGEVRVCPPPTPEYAISHLSMLFGFPETFTELLHYASEHSDVVAKFKTKAWLPYLRAYNGGPAVQKREYGFEFGIEHFPPDATWRQSHSTLTALVAVEESSETKGKEAWQQFFQSDGYAETHSWRIDKLSVEDGGGEEAEWITTNEAARYGVSAIFNLANIREYL